MKGTEELNETPGADTKTEGVEMVVDECSDCVEWEVGGRLDVPGVIRRHSRIDSRNTLEYRPVGDVNSGSSNTTAESLTDILTGEVAETSESVSVHTGNRADMEFWRCCSDCWSCCRM